MDDYKPTGLEFPPDDETEQPKSSGAKPSPTTTKATLTPPKGDENERAIAGFFEDGDDPEKLQEKPGAAKQGSSNGKTRALLVALGVVAAGAVAYHSFNGDNNDSAKIEKPSADAKSKPEPQTPQQSQKPDEATGTEYHCRFNYDASEKKVRAECDGVATAALKIVFDADASTKENAVGKLLIDTDSDGEKDDVSCELTVSKPADRTKSQQLDVVGELECAPIVTGK